MSNVITMTPLTSEIPSTPAAFAGSGPVLGSQETGLTSGLRGARVRTDECTPSVGVRPATDARLIDARLVDAVTVHVHAAIANAPIDNAPSTNALSTNYMAAKQGAPPRGRLR